MRTQFIDVSDDTDTLHRSDVVIPQGEFHGDDEPPPIPAGVFHCGEWWKHLPPAAGGDKADSGVITGAAGTPPTVPDDYEGPTPFDYL